MPIDPAKNRAENKAFEVGYILLRVAERVRQATLRERIENQAISLIEKSCVDPAEVTKNTKALSQLLKLGGEMGYIHKPSVDVLVGELNKIDSAIAESINVSPTQADLSGISGKGETKLESKKESGNLETKTAYQSNSLRQSAIMEKIKQSGSCRMKDIQNHFPEISERTLRYDLGKMVEQGLLERLGNGGPNTFYRIKQARAIQVVPQEHEV